MLEGLNSTFITLIPKVDKPSTFDDFKPISLCNYIYKINAKIIVDRVRPILSLHISQEQFSFLQNRQIHEVVGTGQELLHNVHLKKLKGMIMKVDLLKSFDTANWIYIQISLTQLGFPYTFIKWIMSCITNATYIVLINDSTSPFFM